MGVSIWDRALDDFSQYRWDEDSVPDFSNEVRCLHSDGEWVYIATGSALFVFKKDEDFGQFQSAWEAEDGKLESLSINDIETWENLVFFGTDSGVSVYDKVHDQWSQLHSGNGLPSNNVQDMIVDGTLLYVATDQGISRYSHPAGEFITDIGSSHLPSSWVSGLSQNSTSIFAISNYQGSDAVIEIEKISGKALSGPWSEDNSEISESKFDRILFFDGYLYISTPSGVFRGTVSDGAFEYIPLTNNQIGGNSVTAINYDLSEEILYIATEAGISRYDPNKQMFIEPWHKNNGLISNDIVSIVSTGVTIYAGTNSQGVARWSKVQKDWLGPLDRYSAPPLASNKVTCQTLWESTLFIGQKKGLDRYLISRDTIVDEDYDPRWNEETFNATNQHGVRINDVAADENYVFTAHSPVENPQGALVTEGGLWIFNNSDKNWLFVTNHSAEAGNLSDPDARCLAQNDTHLFIGTGNGLTILNKTGFNTTFINLSTHPDFLGGAVNEILFDNATTPVLYMAVGAVLNETLGYEVGGGLLVLELPTGQVRTLLNSSNSDYQMSSDHINCLEMMDGKLLVGTENGGLLRIDLETFAILDPSQSLGERQFPSGLTIDLGNDGDLDVTYPLFDEPVSVDATEILNELLHYSYDIYTGEANVPMARIALNISIRPDTIGIIEISELNIRFDVDYRTGDFSNVVNSYIADMPKKGGDNVFMLPIEVSTTSAGIVTLKDPVIVYGLTNPPILKISSPVSGGTYWDSAPITFDAQGTLDPDGDPLEYCWTSDNDTEFKGNSKMFEARLHRGWHNITLNVTEPSGRFYLSNVIIYVGANKMPSAVIESPRDNSTYFADEIITFSAEGSSDLNGDEVTYHWHIGENVNETEEIQITRKKVGSGKTLEHVFEKSGYYNISLVVTDGSLEDVQYMNLYIVFRYNETPLHEVFETGMMMGVEVIYDVVHSSYKHATKLLSPLKYQDMTGLGPEEDKLAKMKDNQTHIGVFFSLRTTTERSIFNETLNVSYGSQEEYLDNVNLSTLGLYYWQPEVRDEDDEFVEEAKWVQCPVIEENPETGYIFCDIPQQDRTQGEDTVFILLANITSKPERPFLFEMLTPREGGKTVVVTDEGLLIHLNSTTRFLPSTFDMKITRGSEPIALNHTPAFGDDGSSVTFKMFDLEYSSEYTITITFVMDEHRQVLPIREFKFKTEKEPDPVQESIVWYIVAGAAVVIIMGGLVYFFLIRNADEMEEIEDVEVLSCPRCGLILEGEDVELCPECGFDMEEKEETVIEVEFINCPGCDAKIDHRSKICPFCSLQIKEEEVEEEGEEEAGTLDDMLEVEAAPVDEGVPFDIECPTCGTLVEKGMGECPACGEVEFGV